MKELTVLLVSESHAGIVANIVMDGITTHPVQTFEAGMPNEDPEVTPQEFHIARSWRRRHWRLD